jgi:hypothetical protein
MVTFGWNTPNGLRIYDDLIMSKILPILSSSRRGHWRRPVVGVSNFPSPSLILFSFQTAICSANTWFLKKRGLVMGIMVSGSSLGGVFSDYAEATF